jgi:hypothetical protein
LRLAVDHRVRADEGHEARGVVGRAAGELEALRVPGLDDVGVLGGEHPVLGVLEQLGRGHDLVDQARGLRGLGRHHLAFEQDRGGTHHAEHAGDAGGAAGAGEDADEDLGQADARLGVVGGEAAVAGERDLGADAGREAGGGPGDGLAALVGLGVHARPLDLAQEAVERHQPLEEAARGVGAGGLLHAGDDVEIHAAGEVGLPARDDDAAAGGVAEGAVDGGVELGDALLVEDVHRAARRVPGDGGDAVDIELVVEGGHGVSFSITAPEASVKVTVSFS